MGLTSMIVVLSCPKLSLDGGFLLVPRLLPFLSSSSTMGWLSWSPYCISAGSCLNAHSEGSAHWTIWKPTFLGGRKDSRSLRLIWPGTWCKCDFDSQRYVTKARIAFYQQPMSTLAMDSPTNYSCNDLHTSATPTFDIHPFLLQSGNIFGLVVLFIKCLWLKPHIRQTLNFWKFQLL